MSKIETLNPNEENNKPEVKTIQGSSGVIYEHTQVHRGEELVGVLGDSIRVNKTELTPHYEEA